MISTIFGKRKPINYIIVLTFLFLFYWLVHFFVYEKIYGLEKFFIQLAVLAVLMCSFFIVNFIIKRNKIGGVNSYAILFYTLFIMVFPEVLMDNNGIYCTFFMLLAIRRVVSLRTLKNIKIKIFDATLWIIVASLFYDWALLYLIAVFVAIYFYEPKNTKNWLAPLVGLVTMAIIISCVLILAGDLQFFERHYRFEMSFNADYFLDWGTNIKHMVYLLIIMVTGLITFIRLGKSGVGKINTMRLIALFCILGMVLTLLKSSTGVFPIMVTFFPAVIFVANYIESIKKPSIKEIALIISIILPFIVFAANWIGK